MEDYYDDVLVIERCEPQAPHKDWLAFAVSSYPQRALTAAEVERAALAMADLVRRNLPIDDAETLARVRMGIAQVNATIAAAYRAANPPVAA